MSLVLLLVLVALQAKYCSRLEQQTTHSVKIVLLVLTIHMLVTTKDATLVRCLRRVLPSAQDVRLASTNQAQRKTIVQNVPKDGTVMIATF